MQLPEDLNLDGGEEEQQEEQAQQEEEQGVFWSWALFVQALN